MLFIVLSKIVLTFCFACPSNIAWFIVFKFIDPIVNVFKARFWTYVIQPIKETFFSLPFSTYRCFHIILVVVSTTSNHPKPCSPFYIIVLTCFGVGTLISFHNCSLPRNSYRSPFAFLFLIRFHKRVSVSLFFLV